MTEELQAMDFADERGDWESIVEELEDIVSTVSIPDDHIERIMGVIGKTTVDFSLVSITNREGTILFVNDIFCQVSKYPREELLWQNHRILNSWYFGETWMKEKDVRKWMYDNLSVWKKREATIRNKAKDWSFYRVKSIMESYNIEGAVYRVSVRHEVTEIMEQQERLEAQASELEDAKTHPYGSIDDNTMKWYMRHSSSSVIGMIIDCDVNSSLCFIE